MGWRDSQRALDQHRIDLDYFALLKGTIEHQECAFDMLVGAPRVPDQGLFIPPRKLRALIDTGCTEGAIRLGLALDLGLTQVDERLVQMASTGDGYDLCPVYAAEIEIVCLGATLRVIRNLVAQNMEDDVLLGMDMLVGGILVVDYVHGLWDWRYVSPEKLPVGAVPPVPFSPP